MKPSARAMSESATVGGLLARARVRLAGFDSARLDAEVLLCHVLDRPRAWLFAHGDDPVDEDGRSRFEALLDRRATGEPVAYLVESREFWSLPFEVTPDVLIPRPETELLVEAALRCLPADKATRAVDLGTGSGAISIAIAHVRPLCEVHATEVHEAALAVARRWDELPRLREALGKADRFARGKDQEVAALVAGRHAIAIRVQGETVKADELVARLKSTSDTTSRQIKDKAELFAEGDNIIKLGKHHFTVNTQTLDLTMLPHGGGMALHLSGPIAMVVAVRGRPVTSSASPK